MTRAKGNWGETPWTIRFRAKARPLPERVNVAIVGGGFTGLAAAATVKRLAPEKSVLLLEAERLGNGASGRTGGMVLSETAAGDLPGLGDVLRGYKRILRELGVKGDLTLPGVWELARGEKSMDGKPVRAMKRSPIEWTDLQTLRVVGKVPGGSVNPGKVLAGLALAAERAGAQIAESAAVEKLEFFKPVRLHVRKREKGGLKRKVVAADRVLIATNAGSLELGGELFGAKKSGGSKLTFAVATAPLSKKRLAQIGLQSGRPFYTVDLPYLWGRRLGKNRLIFGSGLVPGYGEIVRKEPRGKRTKKFSVKKVWSGLEELDVRKGEAAERLESLERRVRGLHPALEKVRVTHRWGGPILIMKQFIPVFRRHPKSANVVVSGGYSGHGVALSVYLGARAARAMLGLERGKWEINPYSGN
jgi:glycine/D-amino acid oxidase-like deaminating enzyme